MTSDRSCRNSFVRAFERFVFPSYTRFFLTIFVPLALIYGATAKWTLPQDPDVVTIAVSAWHIGNSGSPFLPGYEHLTRPPYVGPMGFFRMTHEGPAAQYPPGASLLASPAYALTPGVLREREVVNASAPEASPVNVPVPPLWQATVIAVLSTAAAVALLGLVFAGQGGMRAAWVAAWIAGLGTSAWSVASRELFMHGPAMFWLAFGLFLATRTRYWGSGVAFGAAVLTRPHTAFIAACVGLAIAIRDRSFVPVVRIGVASSLGLVSLLIYNYHVFGRASIWGGYDEAFAENLIGADWGFFLKNVLGGLLAYDQGFLLWSPFLLFLVLGLPRAWRNIDPALLGAAIGGLVYLLLQYRMNRYNPGNTTLYRYPLEALTASAPLWFAAYLHWIRGSSGRLLRAFGAMVLISVMLQGLAVWML